MGAAPTIIDRIAVSVGNRVITETDLDREIRITALLNNEKPDFSPANKRKTAERMVDQTLVRNEIEDSRYPPPTAAETEAALQEEKDPLWGRCRRTAAHWPSTASAKTDLKARLTWQLMLVRFIDVRFRPGIQISDDEIRKYFDEHMRAGLDAGASRPDAFGGRLSRQHREDAHQPGGRPASGAMAEGGSPPHAHPIS